MFKVLGVSVAAAGLALALAAPSTAQTTRDAPNPWLDCGLGAMIFPDDNLEVAAAVSNIIWDLGTTAVSSAASSPDSCSGLSNVKSAMFVKRTYAQLEVETAKGEGAYLTALSELMGCGADHQAAFIQQVRLDMADTFAQANFAGLSDDEKAQAFYFTVENTAETRFADHCVAA